MVTQQIMGKLGLCKVPQADLHPTGSLRASRKHTNSSESILPIIVHTLNAGLQSSPLKATYNHPSALEKSLPNLAHFLSSVAYFDT